MLVRINDFFDFFAVDESDRERGRRAATKYASTMMDVNDYKALAALVLHFRPHRIFEIGTYLGGTSDFFLALLPESRVISIAYIDPRGNSIEPPNNDSGLPRQRIGSKVAAQRRSRFTQLYGNSHELDKHHMLNQYGPFDLVFIDGDHSRDGVRQDTELAHGIVSESGVICWHDANPNLLYLDVRRFLEDEFPLPALATKDTYLGGIACWNLEIESRLRVLNRA